MPLPNKSWNPIFLTVFTVWKVLVVQADKAYINRTPTLTAVPSNIYSDTTHLTIADTQLNEFPEEFLSTLTLLVECELNNNKLTQFPAFDVVENTIEMIKLDDNQISCIDGKILDKLTKLRELYLSRNPLVAFPETTLLFQQSLQALSLQGTQITKFPSLVARDPAFGRPYIDMMDIQLYCDCAVAWMFKSVAGQVCNIFMDLKPCRGPPKRVQDTKQELGAAFATCSDIPTGPEIEQFKGDLTWSRIPNTNEHSEDLRCMRRCSRRSPEICPGFLLKQMSDSSDVTCDLIDFGEFPNMTSIEGVALYRVETIIEEVTENICL